MPRPVIELQAINPIPPHLLTRHVMIEVCALHHTGGIFWACFPSNPFPQKLIELKSRNLDYTKMDWQSIARAKFDNINRSIQQIWRIAANLSPQQQRDVTAVVKDTLSQQEIQITESDAIDIVQKTSSGRWKAVDVTQAFCHRASVAHQWVRALKCRECCRVR